MARSAMRCILAAAVVLVICSFICLIVAVASPYWVQSWPRIFSPFKMIGMWQACFAGITFENPDPTKKVSYHGCWWILSTYFDEIRYWMTPAWFIFAQIVTTICLACELLMVILVIVVWFQTLSTDHQREKRHSIVPVNILAFVTIICAILKTVMVVEFGIMVYYDREWMPHPEINYLSWSYGLACVSTWFSIFASIALVNYRSLAVKVYRGE